MAFTFLVEDGTGLTGANSYASVTEADDYLIQNSFVYPTWAALSSGDKEKLLAWASRYLDQRANWYGTKTVDASGLRWPREGAVDADQIGIEDNVVPLQVKAATIEMARYLLPEDRSADRAQDALKELKIDVITLTFDASYRLPAVPNEIAQIIRGLGTINTGPISFAKIVRA